MIGPKSICAIIPTRGDVPMDAIVEHLKSYPEIERIQVVTGDSTFNRYLRALDVKQEIIYTQDDDCVTDIRPLINAYIPGLIINAMTREHAKIYKRAQTLIGFGALFHKSLIASIMNPKWKRDDLFYSKADRIFATINKHKTVFPKIKFLPHATAENRLYRQADHGAKVKEINRRIRQITGIRA